MKEKVKQVINRFRAANPQSCEWSDEQVLDAMFRIAAQLNPSRIAMVGERPDGMAIFEIDLTSDGSDGVR
jgi:hypothetical protein